MKKATRKTVTKPAAPKQELPPLVKQEDVDQRDYKDAFGYAELEQHGLPHYFYKLYYIKTGNGWLIRTLHISNAKKRSGYQTDRSYAVSLGDGKVYTVGGGPHVLAEVAVRVDKKNVARLKPHLDIYLKGLADAGTIRDRISSRRAQGALRRSDRLNNPWFM